MTIVPVPIAAPLTVADKKGKEPATFARTLGIMRLIAPTKKKNIQRALKDIKDTKDIQKTKQSPKGYSNCYHCGETGYWAAQCPIKDIPSFDPEFWEDLNKFQELEQKNED